MGNVTFGSIARILGVSDVAVLNWVRDEARKLPEPSTKAEVVVVTLDEMWHFVKKTEKLWLWRAYDPIARRTNAWVLSRRDDATCQKLLNKIGLEGKTFVTDDWEGYHRLIPDDQLFTDSPENRSFFGEGVKVVVEAVLGSQRQIDHFDDLGDDPRAAAEPCEKVACCCCPVRWGRSGLCLVETTTYLCHVYARGQGSEWTYYAVVAQCPEDGGKVSPCCEW